MRIACRLDKTVVHVLDATAEISDDDRRWILLDDQRQLRGQRLGSTPLRLINHVRRLKAVGQRAASE